MKLHFSKWLIMTFIIVTGCNTSKMDSPKTQNPQAFKSIAAEKYGKSVDYLFNDSKTYVVCLKRIKPTPQIPQNQIRFFIYDSEADKIIFEESSIDAEVEWQNDHQLRVKITPGIISGDETEEDFIYTYDVELRKKIK